MGDKKTYSMTDKKNALRLKSKQTKKTLKQYMFLITVGVYYLGKMTGLGSAKKTTEPLNLNSE